METEATQVIEGDVIKIRPMDSREMLGISRKHFNDEAKKHGWSSERVSTEVYYSVPTEYYEKRQSIKKIREVTSSSNVTSPRVTYTPEVTEPIVTPMAAPIVSEEKPLAPSSDLILKLEERILQLETQVKAYNNELEARNTALVKYKDQEKQIEILQDKLTQLEEKLEKPWWKRLFK